MTSERHFPTDPAGAVDSYTEAPDKPCAKRLTHANVCRFETSVGWCTLEDGHDGQCSAPLPSVLEPNDLGPQGAKRRRW